MGRSIKGFDFVDGDRAFTCHVEEQRGDRPDTWWWFVVSGDRSRYAPFRAEKSDTEASVRERVIAYYAERLAPRVFGHWRGRGAAPAQAGAPAVAAKPPVVS